MTKKSDVLNQEKGHREPESGLKREEALKALRRLRDIGEKLPVVDAAAVVRGGRDSAGRDAR